MGSNLSTFTNWNGTSSCRPSEVIYPKSEDEIRRLVLYARREKKRLRVVGNGGAYTWGDVSMCDDGDIIVNMKNFDKVLNINRVSRTVTAQAGITIDELVSKLGQERLALANMGDECAGQTLGGVTATGSHGSSGGGGGGQKRQRAAAADSFSDQVLSYKVCDLTDNATIHTIRRDDGGGDDEAFDAFVVHLGALAIVLEVTLQVRDWYSLRWDVKEVGDVSRLDLDGIRDRYHGRQRRRGAAFHLSYAYFPSTGKVVEVVRDYSTEESSRKSGSGPGDRETTRVHPTGEKGRNDARDEFRNILRKGNARWRKFLPRCCTGPYANVQRRALLSLTGKSNQWDRVLNMGDMWGGRDVAWRHDQEYACPLDRTLDALKIVRDVLEEKARRVPTVIWIRFTRASNGLMACHYSASPDEIFSYIDVQFSAKHVNPRISVVLQYELSKIGVRAHWGKHNSTTHDVITTYSLWPRSNLNKFVDIKTMYDPDNVLGSSYTDGILSGGKAGSIVMVENGRVESALAIEDDEETSPIALMALPPHSAHSEGVIIPVVNGEVAASLEVVAEC